ncbi:unnamed protein product [Cyprideis torosa]|uniref:Uncharacterized protein n=1 Tax=Cyprideis torosa TaxID=163714 RepID=A0A7R8W5A4_9CRUS|nr:unnamed protein product [Cyprideis torosa]CAG0881491.1 unnamed protein product [Cyprideis torosa]
MNLDVLSLGLSQIRYCVTNLHKAQRVFGTELDNLVKEHGALAEQHLLRCLFAAVDFTDGSSRANTAQSQLLVQRFALLFNKPNVVSLICGTFDNPLGDQKSLKSYAALLPQICKTLKLSPGREIAFAILLLESTNKEVRNSAKQLLRAKLPSFLTRLQEEVSVEEFFQDSSSELIHLLLSFFCDPHLLDEVISTSNSAASQSAIASVKAAVDSLIQTLKKGVREERSSTEGLKKSSTSRVKSDIFSNFLHWNYKAQGIALTGTDPESSEPNPSLIASMSDANTTAASGTGGSSSAAGVPSSVDSLWASSASDVESGKAQSALFAHVQKMSSPDSSLAETVQEMGYKFTQSVEVCQEALNTLLGGGDISPVSVARILSMMVRTHSSLRDSSPLLLPSKPQTSSLWGDSGAAKETAKSGAAQGTGRSNQFRSGVTVDEWSCVEHSSSLQLCDSFFKRGSFLTLPSGPATWNVENFVHALHAKYGSSISWSDVVSQLDHAQFVVPDRAGLQVLVSGLHTGFKTGIPSVFPIKEFYKRWRNSAGQLSLVTQIMKNPDVFSFQDFPYVAVNTDVLKAPPPIENERKEVRQWRSLELTEMLLHLANAGHYEAVQEFFKFPVTHCPDILMLVLLQTPYPVSKLRNELLANLLPLFLGAHPNATALLHHAYQIPVTSGFPNLKQMILCSMAEWYNRSPDPDTVQSPATWNVENFVHALHAKYGSSISWSDVVSQLDHAQFVVPDRAGLQVLVSGLHTGFKTGIPSVFPIKEFYKRWRNSAGQLSLVTQVIMKNPDVFSFQDFPYVAVNTDVLKAPPPIENERKEVRQWRSLELTEMLLHLANAGHYEAVQEFFKFPVTHCPDILMLVLLQTPYPVSKLRNELLANLLPLFLGAHPNATALLHHAYQIPVTSGFPNLKQMILCSMAEWYNRSPDPDTVQSRLTRILDVAQDLKALSSLLNAQAFHAQAFPFVLDLACLASRREYLKLDKWIMDKTRELGEPFIRECIRFLVKRFPALLGKSPADDPAAFASAAKYTLPQENLFIMLRCIVQAVQAAGSSIAPDVKEVTQKMMVSLGSPLSSLPVPQAPPPGSGALLGLQAPSKAPSSSTGTTGLMDQFSRSFSGLSIGSSGSATPGLFSSGLVSSGSGAALANPSPPPRFPPELARLAAGALANTGAATGSSLTLPSSGPRGSSPVVTSTVGPGDLSSLLPTSVVGSSGDLGHVLSQAVAGGRPLGSVGSAASKEIEDEANSYFQKLYQIQHMSVDEMLEHLKRFQESSNPRQTEVFLCMIRNLFDEYKFFSQYPDKELEITAQLFGGIIDYGLVTYVNLGIALKYVLESVSKRSNLKLYRFGLVALDRFKSKLKDYPQYCQRLAAIPHFAEFPVHLIPYVQHGAKGEWPPKSSSLAPGSAAVSTPSQPGGPAASTASQMRSAVGVIGGQQNVTGNARPTLNTTNIDILLNAEKDGPGKREKPPEQMMEKVAFIFNNLSLANIDTKCEELRSVLRGDKFLPWMANYIVLKRASIEPNFHVLYFNLLEHYKSPELIQMVTDETYRNIKVLLRSDKGVANFSDRSLLKNLGHWLGFLTIGRGRPIRLNDMDLISLLCEAFQKGQQELLYVVPFLAKIVESAVRSKIFKPPCPWTMTIMNLLSELHKEPDMKLNLKFEIEVLCRTLKLDFSDLTPGNLLKNPQRLKNVPSQLSAPKSEPMGPSMPIFGGSAASDDQAQTGVSASTAAMMLSNQAAIIGGINNIGSTSGASGMPAPVRAAAPAVPVPPPAPTPGTPVPPPNVPIEPRFKIQVVEDLDCWWLVCYVSCRNPSPVLSSDSQQDVPTGSLQALSQHLTINEQVFPLIASHPALKNTARSCIERAVSEWMPALMERSVKITVPTAESLIKKDFALESNEAVVRSAGRYMVRFLTSAVSILSSKENIGQSLCASITNNVVAALGRSSAHLNLTEDQLKSMGQRLAEANYEICCAFIQRATVEKAMAQLDRKMADEYEARKRSSQEGRRYLDPVVFAFQVERMPEKLRLLGSPSAQQMQIYEEYNVGVPGFLLTEPEPPIVAGPTSRPVVGPPSSTASAQGSSGPQPSSVTPVPKGPTSQTDETVVMLDKISLEVEKLVAGVPFSNAMSSAVEQLKESISHARAAPRDVNVATAVVQKVLENLYDYLRLNRELEVQKPFMDAHVVVLKGLQDNRVYGPNWVYNTIIRLLVDLRDPINYDLIDALVRMQVIPMQKFDACLAQACETSMTSSVVSTGPLAFATELLYNCILEERGTAIVSEREISFTIEMLSRINSLTMSRPTVEGVYGTGSKLSMVIEMLRDRGDVHDRVPFQVSNVHILQGMSQSQEADDLLGFQDKCEHLLSEWVTLYSNPGQSSISDPNTPFTRFLTTLNAHGLLSSDELITRFFRVCTKVCINVCYKFAEQPTTMRSNCAPTLEAFVRLISLSVKHSGEASNLVTKVNLLNRILGIVCGILIRDHENRGPEGFNCFPYFKILIQLFIEVAAPDSAVYEQLATQALTSFAAAMNHISPSKAAGFGYAWLEFVGHRKVVARMLGTGPGKGGWHYYAVFLTQAFQSMRLPDPFTPNLKIETIPEVALPPRMACTSVQVFLNHPPTLRRDLDTYLRTRGPVSFLTDLRSYLQTTDASGRTHHDIPLMNALVLHVGEKAIEHIRKNGNSPSLSTIAHTCHMDIFQNLAVDLDSEGRYLFFSSMVNQLRYPNSHTHYFSAALLYLFLETNSEQIQEQITRVLLERLIVSRPHPWGLLCTFIELIKNEHYNFWDHEFLKTAPEIEKLFENIYNSIYNSSGAKQGRDHSIRGSPSPGVASGSQLPPSSMSGGSGKPPSSAVSAS